MDIFFIDQAGNGGPESRRKSIKIISGGGIAVWHIHPLNKVKGL
jgi:hypothetical protein